MPNPTISIAMPFFNSRSTLALAIRSMLQQSFEDFELLLCDDGSTDGSLEIARSFKDPRVIVWSDGGRRRLAARLNECIDRARGPYLARMDADDVAFPDRLRTQLRFLEQRAEVDLCGGQALVFGAKGTALWRFTPPVRHRAIVMQPYRGFPLWHPTWMGKTEWFRRWRYKETALLGQDQELLLRSYEQSCFANVPELVLGYRQEHVSIKKLARYKLLWTKFVFDHEGGSMPVHRRAAFITIQMARLGANCVAALGGPTRRLGRQGAEAPTPEQLEAWRALWSGLQAAESTSSELMHSQAFGTEALRSGPLEAGS
jgi:glycosyltransferase involved in cell wall biosynthesis